MPDATYGPKVYHKQGGDELVVASGGTLTVEDGGSLALSGGISGPAETLAAADTLTAAESGKTVFLSASTEFAVTLPAPAAGLRYTFIVAAAPSGASYTIVTASSANIIKGHVLSSDLNAASDADFETTGGDTITLVDGKAVAGDRVDLECDGTNWFARCSCTVFDAITITTAS